MNSSAKLLIGDRKETENHDALLQNSIRFFLCEYPKSISKSSKLLSIFHTRIQTLVNPPLEMIWFYYAVEFHNANSSVLSPLEKLLHAQKLLKDLIDCSRSYNVVKRIALIAPVLYLLYQLELNFSTRDPCLREDIRVLLEEIVSHISICCSKYLEEGERGSDSLWAYILDVIRVWTVDEVRGCSNADVMASFFPVLNDEYQPEVGVSLGKMAGAVMNEAFLLRLYLKISQGVDREDFQSVLLSLAIQTIKGFHNFYFLDMLFKMLLEPRLPVPASLSSEDAVRLQKVLYDAVVLVDYSFSYGKWVNSSDNHLKRLSILWVLVADRAIQFARAMEDQTNAILYINAFRESQLVAELIKWTRIQAVKLGRDTIPYVSTPKALINWLLILEDEGIRVFGRATSPLLAKAVMFVNESPNQRISILNKTDADEDQKMGDNAFPCTLCLMKKKRKDVQSGEPELRAKQVKLDEIEYVDDDDDDDVIELLD